MESLSLILLMVHLFSMALGIGAGISIAIAAASVDDVASDAGKAVLGVVKKLQSVGRAAVVLLWLTGIAMIAISYPDPTGLGMTFYLKIAAVLVLTIAIFYAGTLGPKVAAGDAGARSLSKRLGMLGGLMSTIALILAVITFS